jgi:integrase
LHRGRQQQRQVLRDRDGLIAAIVQARGTVDGLPERFSFHDLRHFLASLLISSGSDIKVVQNVMRHTTATTTLARAAVGAVIRSRRIPADDLRTISPSDPS